MNHTAHTTGTSMDDMHPSSVRTNDLSEEHMNLPTKGMEGGRRRRRRTVRKGMRKSRKSMRKGRRTMRKGRKTMRKGRRTKRRMRKH